MIHKLEMLDQTLDKLNEINNSSFDNKKFKEINSQFENILSELKSNEDINNNMFSEEYIKFFKILLNKIDKLETKILPKANLLVSFSKSNSLL